MTATNKTVKFSYIKKGSTAPKWYVLRITSMDAAYVTGYLVDSSTGGRGYRTFSLANILSNSIRAA